MARSDYSVRFDGHIKWMRTQGVLVRAITPIIVEDFDAWCAERAVDPAEVGAAYAAHRTSDGMVIPWPPGRKRDQGDPQPRQHDALDLRPELREGLVRDESGQARGPIDAEEDEDSDPVFHLAELEQQLAAADPDDAFRRIKPTLDLTTAITGLRQGELLGLRWRDVDLDARKIRVVSSFVRGEFGDPTAAGSRLTFHELRHTVGTPLAATVTPMRTLQHWMGHADSKTTQIDADHRPSDQQTDAVDRAFA